MGPTRVNRKLSFESGEEQIKGYGKVTQNTKIFSTKYGNDILEVGSPVISISCGMSFAGRQEYGHHLMSYLRHLSQRGKIQ